MSMSVALKPALASAPTPAPVREHETAARKVDYYTQERAVGGLGTTLVGGALVGAALPFLTVGASAVGTAAGIGFFLGGSVAAAIGVGIAATGVASYTEIAKSTAGKLTAAALAIVPGALAALVSCNGVIHDVLAASTPAAAGFFATAAGGAALLTLGAAAVAWLRVALAK